MGAKKAEHTRILPGQAVRHSRRQLAPYCIPHCPPPLRPDQAMGPL